jgi:hypothetical protein
MGKNRWMGEWLWGYECHAMLFDGGILLRISDCTFMFEQKLAVGKCPVFLTTKPSVRVSERAIITSFYFLELQ